MEQQPTDVRIEMLGGLRVRAGDREVGEDDFPTRRAHELVALLALCADRRLVRDAVLERLWPHLAADRAAANLRKAAHHARRALGDDDAVVLRGGRVELFPGRFVRTDLDAFLTDGEAALRADDPAACADVAARWTGDVLPSAPYEEWTQEARRRARSLACDLLARAGAWERLAEIDPTDEVACRELMRGALEAGRRHVAIRRYERLRIAMVRELGAQPGEETRALYDACTAGVRLGESAFVGRAGELASATRLLAGGPDSETRALLVRGPTGIGKSAFCREVAQRAAADGWRVIGVTSVPSGPPYAPIGAAIEQLLVDGREALAGLPDRTRAILTELSPLAGPAGPLEGPLTRHQVVGALRRALALGGAVPTALLVEDAHLLDEATADVLHQLVAGGGGPLVVVLASRSERMRTSLPHGLLELARCDRTEVLELGPLPDDEIFELVSRHGAALEGDELARIVAASEGRPFFALELARARASGDGEPLPPTARAAITDRFVGVDPETMDVLAMLAVAADELDLATVLALTGLDEEPAFTLLDEALERGVLVVAGTRYRFRHDLVRQAIVEDVPPHRRVALHRTAAGRLAAAGAAPSLVADHWRQGGRPEEAVPWLLTAAREAQAIGAFADGLAQVERLLAHDDAHLEALCLRAELLDAMGDGRAPEAYARAAAAVGDPEAHELRARQALAEIKASDPARALRTLEGTTPRTTVGRLAEALTLCAAAAIGFNADADTAAAKAEEARLLAIELGAPEAILDATWAHALAAHAKGELPTRLRDYLRETRDLPALATRVFDGQLCVTERMLYGGLPNEEIIAFADALAGEARRLGAARGEAFAHTLRGEAEILAGRLEEADADFAEGARLHGRIGAVAGEALSLLGRAQVARYRGRPDVSRPLLAEALVMARESEVGHHTLDRVYGAIVAAAGDADRGIDAVRDAETAIRGPAETCPTCRIAFIVPAAIAAARAGDLERAHRYAADCDRAIEVIALPPAWNAAVEEVHGWLAEAEGRRDDARSRFGAAADGFAAWRQPLDAERCRALART